MVSFDNIHHDGTLIKAHALYHHYASQKFYFKYDANFVHFKLNPNLKEFQFAKEYLEDYQKRNEQEHMKFYLPENEQVKEEVLLYLYQQFYTIGCQDLYKINPMQYQYKYNKEEIVIKEVTEENREEYMQLQETFDREYGEQYIINNQRLHNQHFTDNHTLQLLAYDHGKPAGSLQVFIKKDYVEIDSVGVLPIHRLRGIAAKLQLEVMNRFKNHSVILVADSNDTPKDMYRKQGYEKIGFRYEVMKLL